MALKKDIQNEYNLSIKILDISLKEIKIVDKKSLKQLNSDFNKDKAQFEFNVEIKLDLSKQVIHVELMTKFFSDKKMGTSLGYMITCGDFESENIKDIIKSSGGKVPDTVFSRFIGIIVATSRGILITESKKTIMEGVYLPIINPANFIGNQIKE